MHRYCNALLDDLAKKCREELKKLEPNVDLIRLYLDHAMISEGVPLTMSSSTIDYGTGEKRVRQIVREELAEQTDSLTSLLVQESVKALNYGLRRAGGFRE